MDNLIPIACVGFDGNVNMVFSGILWGVFNLQYLALACGDGHGTGTDREKSGSCLDLRDIQGFIADVLNGDIFRMGAPDGNRAIVYLCLVERNFWTVDGYFTTTDIDGNRFTVRITEDDLRL